MKNRFHRVAVAAVFFGGLAFSIPDHAEAAVQSGRTSVGTDLGGVMQATVDAAARQKLLVAPQLPVESRPAPTLMMVSPALPSRSLTRAPEPPIATADEAGPASTGTMILSAFALMLWIAGRRINR